MKTETKVTISKDELENLIKDRYDIKGTCTFVINEKQIKAGSIDGIQNYSTKYEFDYVEIINIEEK